MKTNSHLLLVSRSVPLRMRNVSEKSCTGTQNTHFVFRNFFFENRAVRELLYKDILDRARHR